MSQSSDNESPITPKKTGTAQISAQLSSNRLRNNFEMNRKSNFIFACVVLLVTVTSSSGNSGISGNSGNSRCVSVKRCESVQWLINNLSRLPSDKRSSVVERISQLHCGINELSEMMVMCPRTISDNLVGGDQDQRNVFGSRSSVSGCIGSVKVSSFFVYWTV